MSGQLLLEQLAKGVDGKDFSNPGIPAARQSLASNAHLPNRVLRQILVWSSSVDCRWPLLGGHHSRMTLHHATLASAQRLGGEFLHPR